MKELLAAFDGLSKNWEEYKKTNDERIAKVESKSGHSEIDEKLGKINKALDEGEERQERLELAFKRRKDSREEESTAEEIEKNSKKISNMLFRKGRVTSEDYRKMFGDKWETYSKALSIDVDSEGGFLVRPQFEAMISKRIYEMSPLRELATVVPISTSRLEFPASYTLPVIQVSGVGERGVGGNDPTANAKLELIAIDVHNMFAKPSATMNYLDDAAIDIESWHQSEVAMAFALAEQNWFVNGDGVTQARGILSYPSGDGFKQIEQIDLGAAAAVTADGLFDLQGALFEYFQMNANWLMHRTTATAIRKLKDADNRYLFSLSMGGGIDSPRRFELLGAPIMYAGHMPVIAANSLSIAYGDFRAGYKVVDRIGIRVIRDNITNDHFVQFKTSKRVGGGVDKFQAIKLGKIST